MLPPGFLAAIKDSPGLDPSAFEAAHESEPVTAIRFNPRKFKGDFLHQLPLAEKVPWSSQGYYLSTRPSFTLDPLFHAGAYYVQDASSMFLEQAVKQTVDLSSSLKVLDLCAAPGGKSTLIQSLISNDSLLISNEVIRQRVSVLQENCTKWGTDNIIVTNNDANDFKKLEGFFDLLVIDAPCSGSGLFRKDATAVNEWSSANVMHCSQRQQRILADCYPALKKDGILIYATCSYSSEEDEDISDWLVDSFSLSSLELKIDPAWKIVETHSSRNRCTGYRFYPDKVRGEGFFLSCFRKNDGVNLSPKITRSKILQSVSRKDAGVIQPFLQDQFSHQFMKLNELVIGMRFELMGYLQLLTHHLYLRKAGVAMGKITRDEFIPDHAFALSMLINNSFVAVSLKREDALQYLRKLEVSIDGQLRGWLLARYQGINLGWIKALPNRMNNYYPKEWRILKSGNQ